MLTSLDSKSLALYIAKQISAFFPDRVVSESELARFLPAALERTEYCFSRINNKYFRDQGDNVVFNHLHTDQYATFLYFLADCAWGGQSDAELAGKIYYLNKALNGVDIFYEVKLPDIFLLVHPVGSVLGQAEYSDYFVCYQRCTVGQNKSAEAFPRLGKGVALFGDSAVIGRSRIGDNCLLSAGTIVIDQDTPSNMTVFGRSPAVEYKPTSRSVTERFFKVD